MKSGKDGHERTRNCAAQPRLKTHPLTIKGESSPTEPIINHQILWLKNWTVAVIHQEHPLKPPWMLQCQIACTPFC
jgi:hypothetical protein